MLATAIAVLATIAGRAQAERADTYLTGGDFLIRNVTIVDGLGNEPQANQDILVRGGKIAGISKAGENPAPDGATIIDGNGLTAMPGLIDAHTHIRTQWHGGVVLLDKYPQNREHDNLQQNLAAYLYAGVTGIFNVGDPTDFAVETRDKLERGDFVGPRLETTGMTFSQHPSGWDGAVDAETEGEPDPAEYSVKVDTDDPEALGKLLDAYRAKGIHTIKLYTGLSWFGARLLVDEARERDMTTVADLWQLNMNRSWMQATGLDGWAHATPFDVSEADVRWMAENDRFVILNLILGELMANVRIKEEGPESLYSNSLVVDIWGKEVVADFYESWPTIREDLYDGPESFYQVMGFGDLSGFRDAFLKNGKMAHDAGVMIVGGTDSPAYPSLWAGESMHRELELMAMAGIPPLEAIKACTHNGARLMKGEKRYGSVKEGMEADLMLVKGEPWKNVSDTRNIHSVFLKGKLVDRSKLLNSWR